MSKFNKESKTVPIVFCSVLVVFSISILWCFVIRREAPLFDGKWANEDGSFILDTDNFTVTISTNDSSETFEIGYTPGINFDMYYPLPEGVTSIYAGDFIHRGEIYRIRFFGIDYIRVKCRDGCFNVRLKKVKNVEVAS